MKTLKLGRPTVDPKAKLNVTIKVVVTRENRDLLGKMARLHGKSIAAFIRDNALSGLLAAGKGI